LLDCRFDVADCKCVVEGIHTIRRWRLFQQQSMRSNTLHITQIDCGMISSLISINLRKGDLTPPIAQIPKTSTRRRISKCKLHHSSGLGFTLPSILTSPIARFLELPSTLSQLGAYLCFDSFFCCLSHLWTSWSLLRHLNKSTNHPNIAHYLRCITGAGSEERGGMWVTGAERHVSFTYIFKVAIGPELTCRPKQARAALN
jgi:hypothetical protein